MFMTFALFTLLYNAMREALGIAKGTKIRMWSSMSSRIVQSEPSKPAPAAGGTRQANEDLFHYFSPRTSALPFYASRQNNLFRRALQSVPCQTRVIILTVSRRRCHNNVI
jgi:hypothetical protein